MRNTFYLRHKDTINKFDGLLLENPVLDRGLILAPVIVASISYNNSFVLGLSFLVITFFTVLLSSFISKKIPYTIRTIMYILIGCVVFVPVAMAIKYFNPDEIIKAGVFLPLLVANSLIIIKSESRFHKKGKALMMLDLFCNGVGFFVVIVIVGIVREFLGSGTFLGNPVNNVITAPAVLLPCSGFIIVGLLAALLRVIRHKLEHPKKKRRYNERGEEIL